MKLVGTALLFFGVALIVIGIMTADLLSNALRIRLSVVGAGLMAASAVIAFI